MSEFAQCPLTIPASSKSARNALENFLSVQNVPRPKNIVLNAAECVLDLLREGVLNVAISNQNRVAVGIASGNVDSEKNSIKKIT